MSELIKISKEFKGAMGGVWLGKEVEIPDGADDIAEFIKQNERLERAWMAMNPQINWDATWNNKTGTLTLKDPPQDIVVTTNEKAEGMKLIIQMSPNKNILERQRKEVERLNIPELTKLFEEKLQSLNPINK